MWIDGLSKVFGVSWEDSHLGSQFGLVVWELGGHYMCPGQ